MEERITVSILSSNRLLRESIARILTKKKHFEVTGFENPAGSADGNSASQHVDVWISDSLDCLIERVLPQPSGTQNPEAPGCILVGMRDDAKQFLKAVSYGVRGYVLEDASAMDLVGAIRVVARGEAVCPGHLARALFDYVAAHAQKAARLEGRPRKQFALTRREQQLVPLVGRGLTNKEIAAELNVSEQTIKSHIHRILRKIGVEDRLGINAACELDAMDA